MRTCAGTCAAPFPRARMGDVVRRGASSHPTGEKDGTFPSSGQRKSGVLENRIPEAHCLGFPTTSTSRSIGAGRRPDPTGSGVLGQGIFRRCILAAIYRPHDFQEIAATVSPEVAVRLDPDQRYGLWWFNRRGVRAKQVSEPPENGRSRKTRYSWHHKPAEEWITVPVPDAGIPPTLVDAAREAIKNNHTPSNAGRRFWELLGGIVVCNDCRRRMTPKTKIRVNATFIVTIAARAITYMGRRAARTRRTSGPKTLSSGCGNASEGCSCSRSVCGPG